ncbi:MAG TPA: hypothetical protein ENH26_01160 [Candidatus Wolfebacteria bacterium]|nr:hypothetical protein [Candidatus Wolfebacteria bacterium]
MNKTGDAIAIILIWGGLIYMLFNFLPDINFSKNSLASTFSVLDFSNDNYQEGIITISEDKENFQSAAFYFNKPVDIFDIKVSAIDSNLLFAGSDKGLFISRNNGSDWYAFSDLEKKIYSAKVYKILTGVNSDEKGEIFVSVFKNGKGMIYRTFDNFFSLEKIFEINNEAIYDFDILNGFLYLGLSDGRILAYSINKKEFRVLNNLSSPIIDLDVKRNGQLIYVALKSGGFLVSQDGGKNFIRQKYLDRYKGTNKIKMFFVDLLNNSTIYAATQSGLICSYDFGNSWKAFKSIPLEKSMTSALDIDNKGKIYVASDSKIYSSCDSGSNWKILDPQIGKREVSIIILNNDKIIIGTRH